MSNDELRALPDFQYASSPMQGSYLVTLLLAIILAFLLVGTFPVWPHSLTWGYYPSSGAGLLLAILIIYLVLKRS